MALIKRKAHKNIAEKVSKVVKDHGPKIAAGVAATGVVAGLLTMAGRRKGKSSTTKKTGEKGKKAPKTTRSSAKKT